ncbi:MULTISPECIES: hypothetical protein [Peribacillus]|uniref:Uncharacterized protein n=1 Tax=Peribacillus simplex TaxID=1478 RepID=A0A120GQG8_9BACI|nr:hypothetical protein [Peribacillus simplex]KWW21271.1 hypothetical protein AS888_16895 [Peribacillus simplex]
MSTNRPNTPVQPAHLYHDVQTAKFIKDTAYLANTCGRSDHLRHHQDVKPVYAKIVDAGDAYFRFHECKKDYQLDMARSKTFLTKGASRALISKIQRTFEDNLKRGSEFLIPNPLLSTN